MANAGLNKARQAQTLAYSSIALTALAEAQLAAGHLGDGLGSIKQALAFADAVGERVWRPESLRIKGRLLGADGELDAAEESYRAAVDEAADLSLPALELRATTDLATALWERDGSAEAHAMLLGVLSRFTEGFETADYLTAQSLLSASKLPAAR